MRITPNTERLVHLLTASYDLDPLLVSTDRLEDLASIGETPLASPLEKEQAVFVRDLIALPAAQRRDALRELLPV